ncbi:MAG: GNAT family protein [Bacteroidales bacterium]|nr:GNAT family protein [Bacteroidales bacterium]
MSVNPEIITSRLLLRPLVLTDADAFFGYRSNAEVNKYQGWIPKTIADAHEFIKHRIAPAIDIKDTWFQFAIINKETGVLIGDVGLHFLAGDDFQAEVGCTINQYYQGKGYATEALKECINYLFNELDKRRVIASIDPRNIQSVKLIERLGFRKEAYFKESLLINGEWCDDVVYAILKHEWIG